MTDILAKIDATLAEHCACGCGQPLDLLGASSWFAGPDCQWRYHNNRATDPHDVYRRPDAAIYPTHDAAEQTLRDMPMSNHGVGVAVDVFHEWSVQERGPDGRWLTSATGAPYVLLDETHVFRLEAGAVYEMMAVVHGTPVDIPAVTAFRRLHLPQVTTTDPMQRALEARRNRNTGPPPRVRPPRRIDATRSR